MVKSVEKSADVLEMHAIVRGHVQGIGFRYTARNIASNVGLKGSVENLRDGTVEIYAQGTKAQLDSLVNSLIEEFDLSIDSFLTEFSVPKELYSNFSIL